MKKIYEIKSRRHVCRYLFFYLFCVIFKENHIFIKGGNPSDKIVIVEEELHGADINGIGNLQDLLRLECSPMQNVGILKY